MELHEQTLAEEPHTNNFCEGWNSRFTSMVGYNHPSIWKSRWSQYTNSPDKHWQSAEKEYEANLYSAARKVKATLPGLSECLSGPSRLSLRELDTTFT